MSNRHDWLFELGEKTAREKKARADAENGIEPFYYTCGANHCDDPACIMNRPEHPEYYGPHPEVL